MKTINEINKLQELLIFLKKIESEISGVEFEHTLADLNKVRAKIEEELDAVEWYLNGMPN